VDTTGGRGNTFTGLSWLPGLYRGMPMEQAIGLATKAAALMVTRCRNRRCITRSSEIQADESTATKACLIPQSWRARADSRTAPFAVAVYRHQIGDRPKARDPRGLAFVSNLM